MPESFEVLNSVRGDSVVIATMTAGYLYPFYSTSDLDFAYTAPMGSASGVGLGLALARPDVNVIVLDGDGSLLMSLGSMVTIAGQRPANLVHLVYVNGAYSITGGQPTPGLGVMSFPALAQATGYPLNLNASTADELRSALTTALEAKGPTLLTVDVESYDRRKITPEMAHQPASQQRRTKTGYHGLRTRLQDG